MTCVVFSVIHISTNREHLEFLWLSLDASVFDHVTSNKGVSALEKFFGSVAFPQPTFNMPGLPQPSTTIKKQLLSCWCSGGSLDLQKFFCVHCYKRVFTEKRTSYFLSEHLSSLVIALYHSEKRKSELVNVLTFLKPDLLWSKTVSGLNSSIWS